MATVDKGLDKSGMESRTEKYKSTDVDGIFDDLKKLDAAMVEFDRILASSGLSEFSSLGYSSASGQLEEAREDLHILGKVPDMLVDEMSESDMRFQNAISEALSGISSINISDVNVGGDVKSKIDVMAASFNTKLKGQNQVVQYLFSNVEKAAREVYEEESKRLSNELAILDVYEKRYKQGDTGIYDELITKREQVLQQQGKLAGRLVRYADWGIDLSTIDRNLDEKKLIQISEKVTDETPKRTIANLSSYIIQEYTGKLLVSSDPTGVSKIVSGINTFNEMCGGIPGEMAEWLSDAANTGGNIIKGAYQKGIEMVPPEMVTAFYGRSFLYKAAEYVTVANKLVNKDFKGSFDQRNVAENFKGYIIGSDKAIIDMGASLPSLPDMTFKVSQSLQYSCKEAVQTVDDSNGNVRYVIDKAKEKFEQLEKSATAFKDETIETFKNMDERDHYEAAGYLITTLALLFAGGEEAGAKLGSNYSKAGKVTKEAEELAKAGKLEEAADVAKVVEGASETSYKSTLSELDAQGYDEFVEKTKGVFASEQETEKAFQQLLDRDFKGFAKNFDFSTKPNKAYFWSGDKDFASEIAKSQGGTIMEGTPGGKVLDNWDWLEKKFPSANWGTGNDLDAEPLWRAVSKEYSEGVSGKVTYVNQSYEGNIWLKIESKTVDKLMKKGVVTEVDYYNKEFLFNKIISEGEKGW